MNIQLGKNGMAKACQVRQVLEAIDRLAVNGDEGDQLNTETEDETDGRA